LIPLLTPENLPPLACKPTKTEPVNREDLKAKIIVLYKYN